MNEISPTNVYIFLAISVLIDILVGIGLVWIAWRNYQRLSPEERIKRRKYYWIIIPVVLAILMWLMYKTVH